MNRWRLNLTLCKLRHNPRQQQRRWQTPLAKWEPVDSDENGTTQAQNENPPQPSGSIGFSNDVKSFITPNEVDEKLARDDLTDSSSFTTTEMPFSDSCIRKIKISNHDFWDKGSRLLFTTTPMHAQTASFEQRPIQQLMALLDGILPDFPAALRSPHPHLLPRYDLVDGRCGSLSLGWHLVQFPFAGRLVNELPDGTDKRFLPGPAEFWPFRYWGKGSIYLHTPQPPNIGEGLYDMVERVDEVHISGGEEPNMAYVAVAKRFVPMRGSFSVTSSSSWAKKLQAMNLAAIKTPFNEVSNRNGAHITEKYMLIFAREPLLFGISKKTNVPPEPMFSHMMTPTTGLLFRWSALTYNGHLIHLDRQFSRSEYKLRDLLVQGTLAVIIMLEYLRRILVQFAEKLGIPDVIMRSIDYTNVRPIYVDSPIRLCVDPFKRKKQGVFPRTWRLWIETESLPGVKEVAFRATVEVDTVFSGTGLRFIPDQNGQSEDSNDADELPRAGGPEKAGSTKVRYC